MSISGITIDYSLPILFGQGWNCCTKESATHVIVFDNGARWAVCKGCSNQYSGPVFSLAIFAPETFVEYVTCQCENSKCEHSKDYGMCFSNANTGKTIPFSGSVCDGCFSKHEESIPESFVVIDNQNNYKCWGPFATGKEAISYGDEHFHGYSVLRMDSPHQ